MSTFDGHVAEFPSIRIDNFRTSNDETPPLAYFLSHVHADHLVGLDACRKVFVYCSPATREILLRLEKYRHRMNFAQGILEVRKQTYRRLGTLIKTIPLQTPTLIELSPGNSIRVTLLDANHCIGAVMFLIEGHGKAVLYTGDIRSEPWWVESLCRNPILLSYVHVQGRHVVKRLDAIYLDTSYVANGIDHAYRRFPSKQEGLAELLAEVSQYPADTLFYVDAWTFGYEDVWEALSNLLGTRIHLDDYRYGLYMSLISGVEPKATEAHRLCGYLCGNHLQKGIFTRDYTRLHSCEKGHGCSIFDQDYVRITPIVARYKGEEIPEFGVGGGLGDLDQRAELDLTSESLVYQLMGYCTSKLQDEPELAAVVAMLQSIVDKGTAVIRLRDNSIAERTLSIINKQQEATRHSPNGSAIANSSTLDSLIPILVELSRDSDERSRSLAADRPRSPVKGPQTMPRQIKFPYARHSSYDELCILIKAFLPKEIVPCTVIEPGWTSARSMRRLFGSLYPDIQTFRHDQIMEDRKRAAQKDQTPSPCPSPNPNLDDPLNAQAGRSLEKRGATYELSSDRAPKSARNTSPNSNDRIDHRRRSLDDLAQRQSDAYEAAIGGGRLQWWDIDLTSTRDGPHVREREL